MDSLMTIEITERYRLRRVDERNWMLQEWREADPTRKHSTKDPSAKWRDTGRYYQRLLPAVEDVLELAMSSGEDATDLESAVAEMKSVASKLCERIGNASLES